MTTMTAIRIEEQVSMGLQATAAVSRPTATAKNDISILSLLDWAFRRECAQIEFDEIGKMTGRRNYGMEYILMQRAMLGCSVDGGGSSQCHHDADVVAAAVAALPEVHGGRSMAVRIAELARAGKTPDWMPGARTRCVPMAWRKCKHGTFARSEVVDLIEVKMKGRTLRREVRACPVTYSPTAQQIASARRFYLDWWGALLELQHHFRTYGGLSAWAVTDKMPPLSPWRWKK